MLYHCPRCKENSVFRKRYKATTPRIRPEAGAERVFEKCMNAGCPHKIAWVVPAGK